MDAQLLYHDPTIAVAVKPYGVLSEHHEGSGLPDLIAKQLKRLPEEVYPVHRLDRDAGGVIVYALTKQAAAALSEIISGRKMEKRYLAAVEGVPQETESTWRDQLFWDSRRHKAFRVDRIRRGVREAILHEKVLETKDGLTLLAIRLETGRTHQIRCQCASRGMPIAGDRRYGGHSPCKGIGLWSVEIAFPHPVSGKDMVFQAPPPLCAPWDRFTLLHPKQDET